MTQATKERLLAFALPEIPASGFSDATLKVAAERAGVSISEIRRHFPHGAESLVEAFSEWADARMRDAVVKAGIPRLRDRITLAVRARLEAMEAHREAARRAAAYLALPQNALLAARLFFTTVDAMWRAAGDKSSDFNYYTKRALLAGVYGSTFLNWLSDASEGRKDSWAFLDARIDDVMNIQKARGELENRFASMPNPLDLLAGFTRPNGPR